MPGEHTHLATGSQLKYGTAPLTPGWGRRTADNFRSSTPSTAPVAAVTCKASAEHGGWSLAPIGHNTKAETYPEGWGPGKPEAVGSRCAPPRLPPGDTRAPRRGRDQGPASGTLPSRLGKNDQVSPAKEDLAPGAPAPARPRGRGDVHLPRQPGTEGPWEGAASALLRGWTAPWR